jgi:hypothetical protein
MVVIQKVVLRWRRVRAGAGDKYTVGPASVDTEEVKVKAGELGSAVGAVGESERGRLSTFELSRVLAALRHGVKNNGDKATGKNVVKSCTVGESKRGRCSSEVVPAFSRVRRSSACLEHVTAYSGHPKLELAAGRLSMHLIWEPTKKLIITNDSRTAQLMLNTSFLSVFHWSSVQLGEGDIYHGTS